MCFPQMLKITYHASLYHCPKSLAAIEQSYSVDEAAVKLKTTSDTNISNESKDNAYKIENLVVL